MVALHWLTGLSSATTYEWQIKTLCEFGETTGTAWSAVQSFTTAGSAKTYNLTTAEKTISKLKVFPNPSTGTFRVDLSSLDQMVDIVVVDLTGQVVYRQRAEGGELTTVRIDNAAAGLYFLQVIGENLQFMERVVIV